MPALPGPDALSPSIRIFYSDASFEGLEATAGNAAAKLPIFCVNRSPCVNKT